MFTDSYLIHIYKKYIESVFTYTRRLEKELKFYK